MSQDSQPQDASFDFTRNEVGRILGKDDQSTQKQQFLTEEERQKVRDFHIQLGNATLKKAFSHATDALELPTDLQHIGLNASYYNQELAKNRAELIGFIVNRDPAEYEDVPEAAIYLTDDLLRMFDVKPKKHYATTTGQFESTNDTN